MKTFLDWSAYKDAGMGDAYADIPRHGDNYAKAIAVCISSKQCEAEGKQVMCPSYKVTGNPNLSTGGRVRLLKAALSGDDFQTKLFEPEIVQALQSCLSCKGCKRECENNVDMPLIKAEFMAQHRARHGTSLRSYIIGNLPRLLFDYPALGKLIRLRNSSPLLRRIGARLTKFAADADLPQPVKHKFKKPSNLTQRPDAKHKVVLFIDTFTRYFEPEIAYAAISLLDHLGCSIDILESQQKEAPFCCGRTYLSQGMIDEAHDQAQRLVSALLPHVRAGKTVIGLEASCVLGLRDDAKALRLGEELTEVASATFLLEEYLARELKGAELPQLSSDAPAAFIHGHCHQKAVGAMKAVRRLLKAFSAPDFQIMDTGCCGMAGTYGLEAENRELSLEVARHSLLPALENTEKGLIVANGFSCRQQINTLTKRRAVHLAEYLNGYL
ncbi:(Fe-S)-binding protein [Teredinibacter turnerae]|uniref:(Fe-S)-binding protein n=1 Tax=Teredinibacter turnerae TaxID=2426 RepID=UPI000374DAF3|nr:(Fe-S)-binding protein [Teredinibacter turnerae]